MKILFVTDYFHPYIHGGAEISVFELGKALTQKGIKVHVLTPNYGDLSSETIEGISVHRYYFPRKLKSFSDQLSPSWYFNPIFFLGLFFQIIKLVWKEKIQIVHVHSLFSIPSAVLAGKILRVPIIATLRDSQLLCNYGYCLSKDQFGRTCNLRSYFLEDFATYWRDKVSDKNIFSFIIQIGFAITGRIRTVILQLVARITDIIIVGSLSQQRTFAVNGFKSRVIHNINPFFKDVPINNLPGKTILYATKMSSGKGLDMLLSAFKRVLREIPDTNLLVIGSGDKQYYENLSRLLRVDKKVTFLPRKTPAEIMKIRQKALLEVAPSIYPESFGRTALEALVNGVPVVASNRGGLVDIVEDGKTGYITNPTTDEFAEALIKGIKNNQRLRRNIKKEYAALKYKFNQKPLGDQIKLYKSILK